MKVQNPSLSIIIVSFNTAKHTLEAIASVVDCYREQVISGEYEIIIVDNASSDNSVELLQKYKEKLQSTHILIIANKENVGFSKANNIGITKAKGANILLLNPDTIMHTNTLPTLLTFLQTHTDCGIVTCKVEIPNGGIDEASHRGFPTPWNAFCHFSKLEKFFPKSRLFAGYTQGWKNLATIHEIDACVGACMMIPKHIGDAVGWLDEAYFFYGEDLDLCYTIREKGYKIYYVPTVSILHVGGVSSGIKKHSQQVTTADAGQKLTVQHARFNAMRIFYKKHYVHTYPAFITWIVLLGIDYLHKKHISQDYI